MSSKLFPTLATVVIALAGAAAMTSALATEATQFDTAPGAKTRAEVKAELAGNHVARVPQYGVATTSDSALSGKTREEVKAELAASKVTRVPQYGDATVFVDQPNTTLTRAEVRAETLANLREARQNH